MRRGSNIINTSSVTAYKGSKFMVDYSSSKVSPFELILAR